MLVVDLLLGVAASVLLMLAAVYAIECSIAVLKGLPPPLAMSGSDPDIVVVVPAHNEQGTIGDTVQHLRETLPAQGRLLVVADNCSDATAEEARARGAEVLARNEPERRGKGYAISHALDFLAGAPPEVVVFVDADCRVSRNLVSDISRAAVQNRRPVQANYVFSAEGGGRLAQVSAFACLVRNLVRPLGLRHLGFPCHLTGSGMAFPWEQIRNAPAQEGNLVEDLSLGLDLAIAGYEPLLEATAVVSSPLPQAGASARGQRRRWEHGQIGTFLSTAPRLIRSGIAQRRLSLVVLAVDLAVPPLALLVVLTLAVTTAAGVVTAFSGGHFALLAGIVSLLLIGIATLLAWARFGRKIIPFATLFMVPLYILWKLPVYLALLFRRSQKTWVRTDRSGKEPGAGVDDES